MNRLPYATAIISVAAAVALWLLATWLEEELRWPVPEPPPTTEISEVQVRPDSAVQVSANAEACEQAEAALRAKVVDAQYCSTNDDCTLFDYGYPIQCLTSVAKNEISALRAEYSNYERSCEYRVYYDCPTGDMERRPVCRSNRCTVELQSTDVLEDRTRDYLGLEQR